MTRELYRRKHLIGGLFSESHYIITMVALQQVGRLDTQTLDESLLLFHKQKTETFGDWALET